MTNVLPSREYSRDPLDIILEREAKTCKGCKHADSLMVFGKTYEACNKGRKKRNAKCYEEAHGSTCYGAK